MGYWHIRLVSLHYKRQSFAETTTILDNSWSPLSEHRNSVVPPTSGFTPKVLRWRIVFWAKRLVAKTTTTREVDYCVFCFWSSAANEVDTNKTDLDLDSIPITQTLENDYLRQKRLVAGAQQKRHKPTRASWGKSLDDEDEVRCRRYYTAAREICLLVLKKYFARERRERVKYFSTREEKFLTVSPSEHVIFFVLYKILAVQQFQKQRFELDYISLQSVVYLYLKQPRVLDSAREYCELIGQKWYHTCVDENGIITGGTAFLSICYHSVFL